LLATPARAAIASSKQAHEKASQRRTEASDKPRKMTPDVVELIEEKLTQEQWSPDQISGRLAKDGVVFISHESIYQHVWKDKKDGGKLIFTCVTAAENTTSARATIRDAG
jgi:IS30 family transposase